MFSTIGLYLPKDRRYDLEDIPKNIETSMHNIPRKRSRIYPQEKGYDARVLSLVF